MEGDHASIAIMETLRGWFSRLPAKRILLWIPAALFIGVFFYSPLWAILRTGFDSALESGWQSLPVRRALDVLGFTVFQAALSTLITLAVGLPGAYLFARFDFRFKRILRPLTLIPFILPTVVVAAGFEALLGAHGWINLR
jgi:thiamine transport system permease protein